MLFRVKYDTYKDDNGSFYVGPAARRQKYSEVEQVRRSRGFARRAAAFVLAVSMSASILPSALAAGSTPQNISRTVSENSVDELGNIDLSDEVFEVPAEPKAAAAESTAAETGTTLPAEGLVVSRPETADVPLVEGDEWLGDLVRADGDYDDLISLQASSISPELEQELIDLSGHKDHTPRYTDTELNPDEHLTSCSLIKNRRGGKAVYLLNTDLDRNLWTEKKNGILVPKERKKKNDLMW